jgi:hypothetical protein
MKPNISKFSFAEMTSNSNGKTSASGTMGIFIILIGGLTFLVGAIAMIFKSTDSDILVQSIALVYAGALLLGYRKSKDDVKIESPETPEDTASQTPETCSSCGATLYQKLNS